MLFQQRTTVILRMCFSEAIFCIYNERVPNQKVQMPENKITHEHLRARRNEIRAQLSKLEHEMNAELDRDPDERSKQLEQ